MIEKAIADLQAVAFFAERIRGIMTHNKAVKAGNKIDMEGFEYDRG